MLEPELRNNVDLVEKCRVRIHGHMHTSLHYQIGAGRVVCNPCGYPQKDGKLENSDFDTNFIVEI